MNRSGIDPPALDFGQGVKGVPQTAEHFHTLQQFLTQTPKRRFIMTTINLKDFYYWHTQDQFIEVSDEVAAVFLADARYEMAYLKKFFSCAQAPV